MTAFRSLLSAAAFVSLSIALASCTSTVAPTNASTVDTLFINGTVLTMNPAAPRATTIAARGDQIVAVGSSEIADRYSSRQVIDLAGATLMPGFNDTHIHIDGDAARYIDLTKVTSIAQMQSLVSAKAEQLGNNEWITGYGWSEDELAENRKPNRTDFDKAAPNNPVVLTRAGAHLLRLPAGTETQRIRKTAPLNAQQRVS